jgi:hypothetical protein
VTEKACQPFENGKLASAGAPRKNGFIFPANAIKVFTVVAKKFMPAPSRV